MKTQASDQTVDLYIKQQMIKDGIPGLSITVLKHGEVLKSRGYGLIIVEFHHPASVDSVYQLASVTRICTGVAIMKLVEDGKLSLDAPVTGLIENLPEKWAVIRVRHLLTHTSGLKNPFEN